MRVTWLALEWPRDGEHTGGVGRYVHRLAAEMAGLVELTVVTIEGAVPVEGVELVTLPRPRNRFDRFYRTPVAARAVVADTRPDVVHAHGDDWALQADVPVVRTFHGRAWSEARSSQGLRKVNHAILAATELVSARRATLRLGVAPESFDTFRCHYLVPPLVGLGDPLPRDPTPHPTVLFIGSHAGRKRGWLAEQTVCRAAALLGRSVELSVVGPAADAASWGSGVRHLSGLSDDDVAGELSRSWVLIAPSSYEGFGIPVVEGLAAGMRVVGTANPGSTSLRKRGGAELSLVLVGDDSLAGSVMRALYEGPWLTSDQRSAADDLTSSVRRAASPTALHAIYERAIARG